MLTQWEYLEINVASGKCSEVKCSTKLQETKDAILGKSSEFALEILGLRTWEAVNVFPTNSNADVGRYYLFKRPRG